MTHPTPDPVIEAPANRGAGLVRLSWSSAIALLVSALLVTAVGIGLGGGWQLLLTGKSAPFDMPTALEALGNSGEIMTGVLAIAITVVAIVVELAANRYSHRVTTLFLRARTNVIVLALFAVTAIQCVWLAFGMGGGVIASPAAVTITMLLITTSLLLLLPYFAFVLGFISPLNIIARIAQGAQRNIDRATSNSGSQTTRRAVALAIEDLQDVTRKAVEQNDRSVATASTNALFALLEHYQHQRGKLPASWFELDAELSTDPDFVALESEALEPVAKQGLWLELKLFRQLNSAVGQSVPSLRDLASLIAINTRMVGVHYGAKDSAFLDLCIKAFNSYLRVSINARDPRTSYYLLNQYRMLADGLAQAAAQGNHTAASGALAIAEHFRYYGQLAHHEGQPFLLEVAAYDLVHLIQNCRNNEQLELQTLTDRLLDVLLELDLEILSETEEPSLVGVRRAQMQLAAHLLTLGDSHRSDRIAADLTAEPPERLQAISRALTQETRSQYWELTERGIHFGYLAPEHHPQLEVLLKRVEQQRSATAAPDNS